MKIQRIWADKNVSLDSLVASVEQFLKLKEFAVVKRKQIRFGEQYLIVAIGSHEGGSRVVIEGRVYRSKNEIFVELSAGERAVSKLSALANLFGAGYVALRDLKSEEVLTKLESDFYNYIDQAMLDSTKTSNS